LCEKDTKVTLLHGGVNSSTFRYFRSSRHFRRTKQENEVARWPINRNLCIDKTK
jgi:hypothetical protein